jgi:serpin B
MKPFRLVLAIVLLFSLSACSKNKTEPAKEPTQIHLSEKTAEIITQSNHFGLRLFNAVALDDQDVNLMISPLSASAALTMLLNGGDTDTYSQIRDMLGYTGLSTDEINTAYNSLVQQLLAADPSTQIALANAVWYRNNFSFHDSYLQSMQTNFDAHIQALDFASPLAPQTINQWAGDNTNGKITEVIDQISDDAVMFLMNALYFKGIWTDQFKTENTYNSPFTLDDGSVISIPTMHGLIQAKAVYEESYHALELFYGRKNFSMIIVVPNAGLSAFLQNATPTIWDGITIALDDQVYTTDIDVSLPKFTFEYEKQLKEQLKTLGMTDAFDPMLADLSKISDADLFVSFVKQNTFVEVNEEGTEAAAVTTVGVDLTSIGEQTQFFVDKPFVFAIREQTTNTLLFVGQVVNPE